MLEIPSLDALQKQDFPSASLYVVATPIGNLGDITFRALHVLSLVDGIACEDKRHSLLLLKHYGITKPMVAIHEHNELEAAKKLMVRLEAGERWAYLSDAGTPGVSDPGARLVTEIQMNGYRTIPIPGASALTAMLSVTGGALLTGRGQFQFLGFLPTPKNELEEVLRFMIESPIPTLFYESPHRLTKTLIRLSKLLDSDRRIIIGRELTKKFEGLFSLRPNEIPAWLENPNHLKGEFVFVLEGRDRKIVTESDESLRLAHLLSEQLSSKDLCAVLQSMYGLQKNEAYELALKVKKGGS
ncbi:16S rRNA (cytidine(1402)-2'-O)-methyltransferase [Polynucleobacter sp. HIN5]|uniref:16S rRNA (cytidine(1402)-2'-O)-methyltransferase n=1 Tax=Polynucleobacter sp. HIN5 TaxID=3047864 RepID=UPI00257459B6|nr:16S rRNA (cytidine(1402)-2'-O)-methyltransferase [Polynucleobacter sp. HIN5]BEI32657.1 16S rRNA (cytidine(1402)-2'-O)-methyltransferase [Polynucleobacter sp. HIN5]